MAKPKRTSNVNAGPLIQGRVPFEGSHMHGHEGGPRQLGWLSGTQFGEQIRGLKNPSYTVMSYGTPIAVHHEGGWHYPDVSHSPSTARHQAITRSAIGVKSARDIKMEKRAANRAAKQKAASEATEQGLWNS